MGDGHHGWASAELLMFVRDLLVREVPPSESPDAGGAHDSGDAVLALSSLVPDGWYGQGWEVHDAPTTFGRISYAVRWHGDRVALLWEVDPHPGQGPVRLVAPGLDPTWSTTDLRGEALLGPVPVPPPSAPPGDGSGTSVAVGSTTPGGTTGTSAPPPEGGSFA